MPGKREPETDLFAPDQSDASAIARIKAAAPLKPKQAQQPMDVGLFSDDATQTDLIELSKVSS